MSKLRIALLILIVLVANPALCQSEPLKSTEDVAVESQLLFDGRRLLDAGKPAEAISECFDKVIINFKSKYGGYKEPIYCARTSEESLLYLLMGANSKRKVTVISSVWANAYFMKGFALIELGRIPEAKQSIEQALAFSPHNSQYLSELGHIYQVEKNWTKSVEFFQAAEDAAFSFSPEEDKKRELGRARRGLGYAFVEMGQLDKAEEKYRQCIEADPDDNKAKAELEYILKLQSKTSSVSK